MPPIFNDANTNKYEGYDLIGDVHGCYDTLCTLLGMMGYREYNNTWVHSSRQVIFVGDVVDRGPKIPETLCAIQRMLEQGSAQMVMGNHEYNLLCLLTPSNKDENKSDSQDFLLPHNRLNLKRSRETLNQFSSSMDVLHAHLQWIRKLPLFLSFKNFRVVHACWDQRLIDQFLSRYGSNRIDQLLCESVQTDHFVYCVLNRLMRGIDFPLPNGVSLIGRDGIKRNVFRAKFWLQEADSYQALSFQPDPLPSEIANLLPDLASMAGFSFYDESEPPLFFGHYWQRGKPTAIRENLACLDYSAVKNGKLVAYRMDDEKQVLPNKFIWCDNQDIVG